jgi:hypothetical protein
VLARSRWVAIHVSSGKRQSATSFFQVEGADRAGTRVPSPTAGVLAEHASADGKALLATDAALV